MKYLKKSLGQNFLIEKNIVKKILNLTDLENKDIIEIGPGKGSLTDEIIKRKPRSINLIEKDNEFFNFLKLKYYKEKKINIFNDDILNFNLNKITKKKSILIGNLPYNISSQILIKILKHENLNKMYESLIFMFQKELGERIIGKFPSKNYGRLSVITNYKLKVIKKFLVSSNCFFPKPKVTSMVIQFKPQNFNKFEIKKMANLEKITYIFFSNRRKMIKKSLKKVLKDNKVDQIKGLNLKLRPENISPEIYYQITELFEQG